MAVGGIAAPGIGRTSAGAVATSHQGVAEKPQDIADAACREAGIDAARLAVDPGFGFGKRIVDNLVLLKDLARFQELGVAVAVGLSRKSMLATLTGRDVGDRTAGSVALAAIAVLNGARIVRAHDVAATVDAIRVAAAVTQGEDFDGT